MIEPAKIPQGTPAWFDMVGHVLSDAAVRADLSPQLDVSLVERYIDGEAIDGGLVQGLRFDIIGGKPSFRIGVRPDERGDITVEVTSAAARELNRLHGAAALTARERYVAADELRQHGDPARFGSWFAATHEAIVDRTC